jgi:hypothetical protein
MSDLSDANLVAAGIGPYSAARNTVVEAAAREQAPAVAAQECPSATLCGD